MRSVYAMCFGLSLLTASVAVAAVPLQTPVQGALRDNAGQTVMEGAYGISFCS